MRLLTAELDDADEEWDAPTFVRLALSQPHSPLTNFEQPGNLRDGALIIIAHPANFFFLGCCQGRGNGVIGILGGGTGRRVRMFKSSGPVDWLHPQGPG